MLCRLFQGAWLPLLALVSEMVWLLLAMLVSKESVDVRSQRFALILPADCSRLCQSNAFFIDMQSKPLTGALNMSLFETAATPAMSLPALARRARTLSSADHLGLFSNTAGFSSANAVASERLACFV